MSMLCAHHEVLVIAANPALSGAKIGGFRVDFVNFWLDHKASTSALRIPKNLWTARKLKIQVQFLLLDAKIDARIVHTEVGELVENCFMRLTLTLSIIAFLAVLSGSFQSAHAALNLISQFDAGVGQIAGLGFDHTTDSVWVYGSSDPVIRQYSLAGSFLAQVARPGESANDFDLEFAPEGLMLGSTMIAEGALLAINGESGVAEIYAVDKVSGSIQATLTTAFGLSHVVGGSYHSGRNTFFLIQDRQPTGTSNDNVVAEINPLDGSVLNTFKVDTALPGFTINFGDIEVSNATGNLFIVSDDESVIAEFTATGSFVQTHGLPAGVGNLSGIGLDDARGEAWVSNTSGDVFRLGGFPAEVVPEPSSVLIWAIGGVVGLVTYRRWKPGKPALAT